MTSNLKRLLASAGVVLGLLPAVAQAQQATTVTGTVTTDAGQPLQGASVSIPALNVGAYTQADGRYTFTVSGARAGQSVAITARRIGYTPKTETITLNGDRVSTDFILTAAATQLTGVVVTALGIQREKSQLGTAQQQITTSQLTQTPTQNVLNAISGKASGVTITGSGTQGGSTNIVIRGSNSIAGNNSPLFVVDGVPISNSDRGSDANGSGSGVDFGSAISDINPEDIESMNILKGPNAAALYGSRAANGVIVITTKRGRNTQGRITTQISSNITWDKPSILPDYQNKYGQGAGGAFEFYDGAGGGINDYADQSWGPKLDGRLIHQFTDPVDPSCAAIADPAANYACVTQVKSPWVAHPNNVSSFFQTGRTFNGNVAVSGGTENANARLSVGTENVDGIIPNNFYKKFSSALSGNLALSKRLSANANLQYIRNGAVNRPGVGYNTGILEQFVWFGRQVDMNALRNYKLGGATNNGPADREYNWNYNYHNNPLWRQYENPESDNRDRLIGQGSLQYQMTDWLNATLRSGSDLYRYSTVQQWSHGDLNFTDAQYQGAFYNTDSYRNENNTELLLTASKQATSMLQVNATAGANRRDEMANASSVFTNSLSVPGIYNVSNSAVSPSLGQSASRRRVNSVYGSASFTFDNFWTVEGTARNDWSSTLPKGNNSYFYPSVNTSVILTDAIPALKNSVLSYAKVRASYARVGNDADPYQLHTVYSGSTNKFNGQPLFSLSNTLANADLKPEITTSSEAGVELSFFDQRASVDATVYDKKTRNQIFNVTVSPTSGYSSKAINAGQISNKGLELLLNLTPVRLTNGFEWNTTFNYATNQSRVDALTKGVDRIRLGGTWGTDIEARVGQPYGTIYGYGYLRDSTTGLPYTKNGIPLRSAKPLVLGNIQPKWTGGWNNSFTYGGFSASALVDFHVGGDLFSVTNFFMDYAGVSKASLVGRELDWNNPGYVFKGIDKASCATACQPNTTARTPEDFYQGMPFPLVEPYIYDGTYYKLREVRVGYDVPSKYLRSLRVSNANIALVGRNLWTHTNVPNIDPEFSYQTGNVQGEEFAALPNPKSWGFSVRVTP